MDEPGSQSREDLSNRQAIQLDHRHLARVLHSPVPMTILLLIRHAQADGTGRVRANRGAHLDAEGWMQAAELPRRLRGVPLDAIYSSPLARALETAAPLAAERGLEVIPHPQLTEMNLGDRIDTPPALLTEITEARAVAALDALRRRHGDAVLAVVTHGDVIRAVLAHYAGIRPELCREVAAASISVVRLSDEEPQLCLVDGSGALANPEAVRERN